MFIPDTPIAGVNKDELGRAGFAQKLGDTIRDWERNESIVIALYGSWGSGKTSILNMSLEHIENTAREWTIDKRPIIIRFNPWNFSEQDQLLQAFFQQLHAEVSRVDPRHGKELKEQLGQLAKSLGAFKDLPTIGGLFGTAASIAKSRWPDKSLNELKAGLNRVFASLGRRLVIVLDDIDRLTQQEIRQLFQMIKINADFPNTIYLASFDRHVVESALNTEQGILGRDYLEKIVQVGFDVPPIDPSYLAQFLTKELDKVLSASSTEHWDARRWGNLYYSGFRSLFTTLRDVKRYVNGLAFNLRLILGEVNPVDFIGLEALRVFTPEVYRGIATNKSLFSGTGKTWGQPIDKKELTSAYEQVFETAGARKAIARSICQQLFPQMHRVYQNTFYGNDSLKQWRAERRIAADDVFDVYFLLGTPKGDVSQAELRQIISVSEQPDKLVELVSKIVDGGRTARLLDMLIDLVDALSEEQVKGLCMLLIALGEALPEVRPSFFEPGTDLQIGILIYTLLQRIKAEDRCAWFTEQITNGPGLYMPIFVLSQSEPNDEALPESRLFSEECIKELKAACIRKIETYASNEKLSSVKNFAFILFQWRDWATDTKPLREYIERLLASPVAALDLLVAFLSETRKQVIGEYVGTADWSINLKPMQDVVDPRNLEAALAPITEEQAAAKSERHRLALIEFRKAIQKW
jgi:predicted KAP-like P-loop ATPase